MTEEVAALNVRLEATLAKFNRSMDAAQRKLNTSAKGMETRAKKLDDTLSEVGNRFGIGITTKGAAVTAATLPLR